MKEALAVQERPVESRLQSPIESPANRQRNSFCRMLFLNRVWARVIKGILTPQVA